MPKHLISIHDFSKEDILDVLRMAADFEKQPSQPISTIR
jgi:aspartate carbamoyltransferase catalytic subunit